MKVLILVIVTTWSFSGYLGSDYRIVNHPRDASIYISQQLGQDKRRIEPDQRIYKLYQVDFSDSTIQEIRIPNIIFDDEDGQK